jgi:hypothetical protein
MSPIVWVVLIAIAAVAAFFVWRKKFAKPATPPSRSINSTVAGVTTEDERGLSPQQVIVNLQSGDKMTLLAVDKDGAAAVRVQERGRGHVGWLQDGVSDQVRAALDAGKRVDCRITDITGGTRGNPNFGVSIQIDIY